MHVEQALGAGAFVKVVDVLRDEEELARPFGVEPGQRVVRGVGFDFGQSRAAGVVELVDERRIADIGFGGRDVLDMVAFPQAVGGAERRQAALRRHTRARQHDDVADGHVQ